MLPMLDGGAFGGQPRFKDILEMAQTVEACGLRRRLDAGSFHLPPRGQQPHATGDLGSLHHHCRGRGAGAADLDRRAGHLSRLAQSRHRRQDGREPGRDQRRPLHPRGWRRLASTRIRHVPPAVGSSVRALQGQHLDHQSAAAHRPRRLRGRVLLGYRGAEPSRRAAPGRGRSADSGRHQRPEDDAAGGAVRRRLELRLASRSVDGAAAPRRRSTRPAKTWAAIRRRSCAPPAAMSRCRVISVGARTRWKAPTSRSPSRSPRSATSVCGTGWRVSIPAIRPRSKNSAKVIEILDRS